MTAYNKMNSVHASHSKFLLDEILHKEWQFDGMTMSDWFGTYTTVDAIKAGLDLEMPGPPCVRGDVLERAMTGGLITDQDLNICVRRVRRVKPSMPHFVR
jgi:beta-glucosidase